MNTQEAITLIKQALAMLQKDWEAHINLVEAVRVVEGDLGAKSKEIEMLRQFLPANKPQEGTSANPVILHQD